MIKPPSVSLVWRRRAVFRVSVGLGGCYGWDIRLGAVEDTSSIFDRSEAF